MKYGYARVSTDGQGVAAQVAQLRAAGAAKVFRETASGAKTDRAQLRKALAELEAGDVLMVTRLDRLARSTRDLLNTLRSPPPLPRTLQRSSGTTHAKLNTARPQSVYSVVFPSKCFLGSLGLSLCGAHDPIFMVGRSIEGVEL